VERLRNFLTLEGWLEILRVLVSNDVAGRHRGALPELARGSPDRSGQQHLRRTGNGCVANSIESGGTNIKCAAKNIECTTTNIESDGRNIECAATNKIIVKDMATVSFNTEGDLLPSLNLSNIGSEYDGAPESFVVDISPGCGQNLTEFVHIIVNNGGPQGPTTMDRATTRSKPLEV
jgi:hypothetical protein